MKTSWFIFVVLLAMCLVLCIAFLTPQVPYEDVVQEDGSTKRHIKSHGFTHDKYPTMKQGGPGAERHAVTLWVGWAFTMLSILFFTGCLSLGATRHGKLGPTRAPFILGTVLFAAVFSALFYSYYTYMHEETHSLFLSLPRPTAWMIFAVWPFPLFFAGVYYFLFDSWYFTEADEKRLEEIVADNQQSVAKES